MCHRDSADSECRNSWCDYLHHSQFNLYKDIIKDLTDGFSQWKQRQEVNKLLAHRLESLALEVKME